MSESLAFHRDRELSNLEVTQHLWVLEVVYNVENAQHWKPFVERNHSNKEIGDM